MCKKTFLILQALIALPADPIFIGSIHTGTPLITVFLFGGGEGASAQSSKKGIAIESARQ